MNTDDVNREVGQRVRTLRRSRGWTQTELSKRSGVSMNAIVKTERGQREPQVTTLSRLAQAFGVEVERLTGGAAQAATPAVTGVAADWPPDGAGGRYKTADPGMYEARLPSPETTQRFLADMREFVRERAVEADVPADALLLAAAGEVLSKLFWSEVSVR